jgi:hypothetical protein
MTQPSTLPAHPRDSQALTTYDLPGRWTSRYFSTARGVQ